MRLRLATEIEAMRYFKWRAVIFSIPFCWFRPTKENLDERRIARHLKKLKPVADLALKERQKANKRKRKLKLRMQIKYSFDEYRRKVRNKEIYFIEEKGSIIGYVEIRASQKRYRIVDWTLSGEFQELDYMKKVLEKLKKKAGKREIFILAPKFEGEWSCEILTSLGFHHEKVEWVL